MPKPARRQRRTTSDAIDQSLPASYVVNRRFNGLSHFCELTDYPITTVWGWLRNGYIPARSPRSKNPDRNNHEYILEVAALNKIRLRPTDFVTVPPETSPGAAQSEPGDGAAALLPPASTSAAAQPSKDA